MTGAFRGIFLLLFLLVGTFLVLLGHCAFGTPGAIGAGALLAVFALGGASDE